MCCLLSEKRKRISLNEIKSVARVSNKSFVLLKLLKKANKAYPISAIAMGNGFFKFKRLQNSEVQITRKIAKSNKKLSIE